MQNYIIASFFLFIRLFLGITLAILRTYPWFCSQGSLLVGLETRYVTRHGTLQPWMVVSKVHALLIVLSFQLLQCIILNGWYQTLQL